MLEKENSNVKYGTNIEYESFSTHNTTQRPKKWCLPTKSNTVTYSKDHLYIKTTF